jgi:hypothetical protein
LPVRSAKRAANSCSLARSILFLIAVIAEVLSDFRRNLMIRHLVHGLHPHDASTEVGSFEPIAQFALGLTRAEYQNGFGMESTQ